MGLSEYKQKRKFSRTPEPSGRRGRSKKRDLIFVIQKHDASHLHYDFRLEMKGVLKSWAVPKGPSMNPADKRLAVHVEDHPYEYKDFEGIIPKGNYGAGTVIIWDTGTYGHADKNLSPVQQEKRLLSDYYKGSMKIILKGKKLKGEFALVKTETREVENAWLLIKKKDQYASKETIIEKDRSVVSGKTIEQLEKSRKAKKWISNSETDRGRKLVEERERERGRGRERGRERERERGIKDTTETKPDYKSLLKKVKEKKRSAFPSNLRPMLATLTNEVAHTEGWVYEIKWDGYRALAYLDNGKADLRSRNNNSFKKQFYPVQDALSAWKIKAVVDGEIVAVNEDGISSFQQLQNWRSEADGDLLFYVFDILWLDGYDLTALSLNKRREILRQIIPSDSLIRFSENFDTDPRTFLKLAGDMGLEGIIAKKEESEYVPGFRTKNWLKLKAGKRHEAVIGGYTLNDDSSKQFSSLLLGVYENGRLKFIGQAGTGYSHAMQKELKEKMKPLETTKSPFDEEPEVNRPTRFRPKPPKAKVTWLKPKLVCEVKYQELTSDGIMRHPSFQGLRTDKKAKEVVMEPVLEKGEKGTNNDVAVIKKGIIAPTKGMRKTLLNPHEQTQVKRIGGHELKFTNVGKIYWPKEGITKGDMINYYYKIAPFMLPYMKDRPQSLNRHPNGINGPSFYQKNVSGKVAGWLTTHNYVNTSREGSKKFLVCTDEASLLYIANLGCIEMNPWHSRIQTPGFPDWCVIDLDPDTNPFSQVIETALVIKQILDAADIPAYCKTSGSTGIHILIPLGAEYEYEQSKLLAELIVGLAHAELREYTSLERTPAKRKGKIYLDFLQNRPIQTIAAPYSLRPKPGATVSAPIRWEELNNKLRIENFTIHNMLSRIQSEGDLLKGILQKKINLERVLNKIGTVFS